MQTAGNKGEEACEDLLDFFMGRDTKTQRRLSRASSAASTGSSGSTASSLSSVSTVGEDEDSSGGGGGGKCPVTATVGGMGRKLVVDNVKTFLFAGHDTTASALSWALYLIARDTEAGEQGKGVRQRILQEAAVAGIDTLNPSTFPPSSSSSTSSSSSSSSSTSSSLLKLEFLDAVVKETLRLYPSAGFTRRVPPGSAPVTLAKGTPQEVTIPSGVEVFVFPYLLHRDPALWDDAATFDPDRWVGKKEKKKKTKKKKGEENESGKAEPYLPFSLGLRNCVGMRLALTEIKTTLLALLQRFEMAWIPNPEERGDKGEPHVTLYMTLVPNKIDIRFTETREYAAAKSRQ